MEIVVKQRRRWAITFAVATLATGCGDGLFTRSVVPPGPDAGPQDAASIQDTVSLAPETATLASTQLQVKAGARAMGQLDAARVIVPAMSFDQDWYAVSGQAYRATDHTLGADFYGLDRGPVYFTLLRFCADKAASTQPAVCSSMLCQ